MTRTTLRAAAVAVAAVALAAAALGAPAAHAAADLPALASSSAVTTADLDGDGTLDVLAGHDTGSSASLLRGLGGGQFAPPVAVPLGAVQADVETGDLDGDGRLDVVAAAGGGVAVALGKPDGTFAAPVAYPANGTAGSLALADFNKSGDLDVVVTNGTNEVRVLYGAGDGTFFAHADFGVPWTAVDVVAVPLAGGTTDLAVLNRDGSGDAQLTVLTNTGAGNFADGDAYALRPGTSRLAGGQLNGDGKLDLVAISPSTAEATVLLGTGADDFTVVAPVAAGTAPTSVAIGDTDGDHDQDVVVANASSLWILAGDGAGTLSAPPPSGEVYVGRTPTALALAEIDGDDADDVLLGTTDPFVAAFRTSVLTQPSSSSLTFDPQPVSTVSDGKGVSVMNAATSLVGVRGFALSGPDAGDFLVGEQTCRRTLYPGSGCSLLVRFAPTSEGTRTAELSVVTAGGTPARIALTGFAEPIPAGAAGADGDDGAKGSTGGKGDTGPDGLTGGVGTTGVTGVAGDAGVAGAGGARGAAGPQGAVGPRGAAGRPGEIRLTTCTVKKAKGKQRKTCSTRTLAGDVTFTANVTAKAVLSRKGVVYARGTATRLTGTRRVAPGRYSLTLTTTRGGTTTSVRRTVAIR